MCLGWEVFAVSLKVIRSLLIAPVGFSCFFAKPFQTLIELLLLINVVSDPPHIKRSCHDSHWYCANHGDDFQKFFHDFSWSKSNFYLKFVIWFSFINRGDRIRTCDLVLPKQRLGLVGMGVSLSGLKLWLVSSVIRCHQVSARVLTFSHAFRTIPLATDHNVLPRVTQTEPWIKPFRQYEFCSKYCLY